MKKQSNLYPIEDVHLQKRKHTFYVIYNTRLFGYVNHHEGTDPIINAGTIFFNDKKRATMELDKNCEIVQKVTFTLESIE